MKRKKERKNKKCEKKKKMIVWFGSSQRVRVHDLAVKRGLKQGGHTLLQPQLWPSLYASIQLYHRFSFSGDLPPHTQGRVRTTMLFPTLDTFLIVWSCRCLQKPVSVTVDYAMEMMPNKAEMAVHGNTSK